MRLNSLVVRLLIIGFLVFAGGKTFAQTMTFSVSDADFVVTNVFSDVDTFNFDVEIDAPLAVGVYDNPPIVSVTYQVMGSLASGTPSGFTAFNLMRTIPGDEFYAQGSSLRFEIAAAAVLSDGVQAAELAGSDIVFTFNGRENDNGRFHPALFELRADGTGRIQNSDNLVTASPVLQVNFGDEYINDLMFDPGNTTLLTANTAPAPPTPTLSGDGGGGSASLIVIALLVFFTVWRKLSFTERPRVKGLKRLVQ